MNVLKVCLGLTSDPASLACRLLQWPPVSTYNLYLGIITSKGIYQSCFGTSIQRAGKCCLDHQDGDWEALTFYMSPVLRGPGDNFINVFMDQCHVFKLCLKNLHLLFFSTLPPHTIPHTLQLHGCMHIVQIDYMQQSHHSFIYSENTHRVFDVRLTFIRIREQRIKVSESCVGR